MVCLYVSRFPPSVHNVLQELCGSPAMEGRDRTSLHPLGEWVDGYEKEAVPISILRKRSCGVNAPAEEGRRSLVDPAQLLQRWQRNTVLLPRDAATHAVAYVFVHTRPPELFPNLAEQLVAATMSQVLVDVR